MSQATSPDPANRGRSFFGVERSLTGRRWAERLDAAGSGRATAMAQAHAIPEIVARILAGRGVGVEEAPAFLDPTLRRLLPDPSVLTDMDKAAARIADAIVSGETIAIFGDYDVDGASSAALLTRFLRAQVREPIVYIPDRIFEGYGPNADALGRLAAAGARLVITVDCGSTSGEVFRAAPGPDIVVLDHHQVGAAGPAVTAFVNPNRQDDLSGLGHLAAVGVTFLAVVAVNRELRRRGWYGGGRVEPDLTEWLDLVALGTVCDVVPLVGLNRAFVAKGLRAMARRANRGLARLADVARLGGEPTPYHLGFLFGPRINAGGRIGDAALGARLLATDDPAEAEKIAGDLDRLNQERQAIETAMLAEAVAEAEAEIGAGGGPAVIVTASERWHPGVVGLIASRLKDRFGRPAVAVAFQPNGLGSGSARSVPGFDIGRAVREAAERGLILKGGGHAMAAGLTLSRDRLGDLRGFLATAIDAPAPEITPSIAIDAALAASGATDDLVRLIERAGPFGAAHPEPVFALPFHAVAYAEAAGNGHVRATLRAADGTDIKAMAFRAADTELGRALLGGRGRTLHVAGSLMADQWQGRRQATLRVVDVAVPNG